MEIIVKCASGKCPKTSKDVEKRFRNRIFKQNFVREICGEDEKITQRESLYFIQIKGVRELWDIRNEVECDFIIRDYEGYPMIVLYDDYIE